MYNRMLNFFENECCIENIFMKKFWYIWDMMVIIIFAVCIIFYKLGLNTIITIIVVGAIFVLFFAFYFEIYKRELQKELQGEKVRVNWLVLFNNQKFLPAYFEYQEKKLMVYFKSNNITDKDKEKFLIYVNEDLESKYPPSKIKEKFLSVIVPVIVSVISVYITNAEVKDISNIIVLTIIATFCAGVIIASIYVLSHIGCMLTDPRRNLLDLKDILRNINIQ